MAEGEKKHFHTKSGCDASSIKEHKQKGYCYPAGPSWVFIGVEDLTGLTVETSRVSPEM